MGSRVLHSQNIDTYLHCTFEDICLYQVITNNLTRLRRIKLTEL
jgi:hypothetical protein